MPGRRLSKKVCSTLGPLCEGAPPQAVGRELCGCPKYFGLWQGSLPPPLRGTAPPLAQAPPPPVSGEAVSQREVFRPCKVRYRKKAELRTGDSALNFMLLLSQHRGMAGRGVLALELQRGGDEA